MSIPRLQSLCDKVIHGRRPSYELIRLPQSLNRDRLPTSALRAVAVAHETVHAAHSHPELPEGQHSFIRHLLIAEEGEAHLADQMAAWRLGTKHLDSPLTAFIAYIFTLPLTALWTVFTAYRLCILYKQNQTVGKNKAHQENGNVRSLLPDVRQAKDR